MLICLGTFCCSLKSFWELQTRPKALSSTLGHVIVATAVALAFVIPTLASTTETVLHSFAGGNDGANPIAGLVIDKAGNLYGTTTGLYNGDPDVGTVFKVTKSGTETVLHKFTGTPDGANPYAGLVRDTSGNIYGTTRYGGASGWGTVFKINKAGKETVLYSFTGGSDGSNPTGNILLDAAGNIYGTTTGWGISSARNPGNVFKIDTTGHETVLWNFSNGADGGYPEGLLVRDGAGNIYGTTYYGGAFIGLSGFGVAYKLDVTSQLTVLHAFTGGIDGMAPLGGLIQDATGNFYGTTSGGGSFGHGTVFMLDAIGSKTVLYNFTGLADGSYPARGLVVDAGGNFYGTTGLGGVGVGTVFKLDRTGTETAIYSFTGGVDGGTPYTDLVLDSTGSIYGTTVYGGTSGSGVVFKLAVNVTPFLSFPLPHKTASSAKITSVFDHSSVYQYCADGTVTAYDGESGNLQPALVVTFPCGLTGLKNQLFGFEQSGGNPFSLNGQYDGGGDVFHLSYDGHPAYDYKTTDPDPSGKIPVLAAANGQVVCVNISTATKAPCNEGPGEVKIDHGNGYFTVYLHLSSSAVNSSDYVTSQQQIGISGKTGTGGPHLHFEVRQGTAGSKCPAQTCIPVDPYGWTGTGSDPYTRAVNINLWQ